MNENTIYSLVGDVPVSEQIELALTHVAPKEHTHDYATLTEVQELKRKVEELMNLVGDTSVADQIAMALKK